ncbi:MAG: porin [Alloprevotella sp.]|nr:porin [Alloprevotella sp.]
MKKSFLSILFLALASFAAAQSVQLDSLMVQVRGDYVYEDIDGHHLKDASGFKGKYFNFILRTRIGEHFVFNYRQRLNKSSLNANYFDATDWLYLDYHPTEQWTLSAGKQIVAIGGYEYDKAPIDVYYASEYWNNINPYEWGVSATFGLRSGKDRFTAQFCQSPFRRAGEDTYAYNLLWSGRHGCWSPLWSLNAIEYAQGRFIGYAVFGNAFDLGRFRLELDLMNRAVKGQRPLLRDCSVMGELTYKASDRLSILAKGTYDVNRSHHEGDRCVMPGTEISHVGAGVEYFPLRNRTLRLHADAAYTFGSNGNPEGTLQDKHTLVNCGLTWYVNLRKIK